MVDAHRDTDQRPARARGKGRRRVRPIVAPIRHIGVARALLATSRGLRVVAETPRGVQLLDANLRALASIRLSAVRVLDAQPLRDGSAVVAVSRTEPSQARLLWFRPGRATRTLWTGRAEGEARLERTADGVVRVAASPIATVVAVDDRGHVRTRNAADLGLPSALATCPAGSWTLGGSLVATSGRPSRTLHAAGLRDRRR